MIQNPGNALATASSGGWELIGELKYQSSAFTIGTSSSPSYLDYYTQCQWGDVTAVKVLISGTLSTTGILLSFSLGPHLYIEPNNKSYSNIVYDCFFAKNPAYTGTNIWKHVYSAYGALEIFSDTRNSTSTNVLNDDGKFYAIDSTTTLSRGSEIYIFAM